MTPLSRAFLIPIFWPVGTTAPVIKRVPRATYALLGLNGMLLLLTALAPEWTIRLFGLLPGSSLYHYFTYGFMHEASLAGLLHFLVNMFFLWIFAPAVESRIGWWRLVLWYLLAAAFGGIAHRLCYGAGAGLIGASAAVYGIIGAYVILYPFSSVKCFFCLLVLVVPLFDTTVSIMALFFAATYWVFDLLASLFTHRFNLFADAGRISLVAHLGGIAAGAALTAASYGLRAFTRQAADPEADRLVQGELAKLLKAEQESEPVAIEKGADVEEMTPEQSLRKASSNVLLQALREHVIMGRARDAEDVFAALAHSDPEACLRPGGQMDLARMLARAGRHELAIEALERLLRRYPEAESRPYAEFELGRELIALGKDLFRAAGLLEHFLASKPTLDMDVEARELLKKCLGDSVNAPAAPVMNFDELEDPDSLERGSSGTLFARVSELFGDLSDTGANAPPRSIPGVAGAPVRPHVVLKNDEESQERVSFDPGQAAAAGEERRTVGFSAGEAFNDAAEDSSVDMIAMMDFGDLSAPPTDFPEVGEQKPIQGEEAPERINAKPVHVEAKDEMFLEDSFAASAQIHQMEPEREGHWAAEDTLGAAIDLSLEITDRTHSGTEALWDERSWMGLGREKFAVLVMPGQPHNTAALTEIMGALLGMTPEATHYAILRRRGVLAEGLTLDEAEKLARGFAARGQSVTLAAQTRGVDFGEPQDLISYHEHEGVVQWSTFAKTEGGMWSQVLCLSAAVVSLQPGTPGRAVLDLFVSDPNRHLRIWENIFIFPKKAGFFGEGRFRKLAEEITARAPKATHTQALDNWLEEAGAGRPVNSFGSLIEYQSYLRWHMLSHLAPMRPFPAKRGG